MPLVGFLPGGKSWAGTPTPTKPAYDFAADSEARYEHQLRKKRSQLLNDLVKRANQQAASAVAPTASDNGDDDLVSKLERLSALYRAGSLSYDEFQRAKSAASSLRQEAD